MAHLSTIDLVGFWLGIFLTFCILSFLYKDNPVYKFAEHLFIGVSVGFVVTKQYYDTMRPKLILNLFGEDGERDFELLGVDRRWIYVLGLALSIMLLMKLTRRWGWLARYPIAFVVAFYAGIQINGVAQGDLGKQADRMMEPVAVQQVNINDPDVGRDELKALPGISPAIADKIIENRPIESFDQIAELPGLSQQQIAALDDGRPGFDGLEARAELSGDGTDLFVFGTISELLLLLGLIAGLIYFYFSIEQRGVVGRVSRVGVWVLMIGFGASFGYTVQGRIALAIGRARDVMGDDKDAHLAEQIQGETVAILSIAVIVATLVVWELRKKRDRAGSTTS